LCAAGVGVWEVFADCSLTNIDKHPLPEWSCRPYQGFPTGLYPNYANNRPPAHLAAGLNIAVNEIKPLNSAGNVDTNSGKIVLLSIGMSNTTQEWATKGTENFRALANADPAKNPRVTIVDGALGGQAATDWTNFPHRTWSNVLQRLDNVGATTNQVQVIWMKQARRQPNATGPFPTHAQALQDDLEKIMRLARSQYPNLKIAFVSSRTRSYEDGPNLLNPEPFAYEGAFSTKWMIEKQINGAADLNFGPAKGPVVAPYLSWGPYLWADGTVGRSDGLIWLCSDLEDDFTHPSATGGVPKVARQLLAFFKTDPTATPWFLRTTVVSPPPICTASADVTNGVVPLTVNFRAVISGSVTQAAWTFDDGEFSFSQNPTKIFYTPGVYTARVTVTDTNGNTAQSSVRVTVNTTFDLWRADKFTSAELANPSISGASANVDFDPFPNLLEFVMGLEPKTVDPTGVVSVTASNGVFLMRFPHFKFASDATLAADVSSDLSSWSPAPVNQVIDLGQIETIEVAGPISGNDVTFYRLRATH